MLLLNIAKSTLPKLRTRKGKGRESGEVCLCYRMTGATPVWDPHFIETLEGSFSSVSTATIARVGAFFSIFRDLQDFQPFALLRSLYFWGNRSDFGGKKNEISFFIHCRCIR